MPFVVETLLQCISQEKTVNGAPVPFTIQTRKGAKLLSINAHESKENGQAIFYPFLVVLEDDVDEFEDHQFIMVEQAQTIPYEDIEYFGSLFLCDRGKSGRRYFFLSEVAD